MTHRADGVHLGVDGVRPTGAPGQAGVEAILLEPRQHIASRLVVAAEHLGDPRRPLATLARQQDLAADQQARQDFRKALDSFRNDAEILCGSPEAGLRAVAAANAALITVLAAVTAIIIDVVISLIARLAVVIAGLILLILEIVFVFDRAIPTTA